MARLSSSSSVRTEPPRLRAVLPVVLTPTLCRVAGPGDWVGGRGLPSCAQRTVQPAAHGPRLCEGPAPSKPHKASLYVPHRRLCWLCVPVGSLQRVCLTAGSHSGRDLTVGDVAAGFEQLDPSLTHAGAVELGALAVCPCSCPRRACTDPALGVGRPAALLAMDVGRRTANVASAAVDTDALMLRLADRATGGGASGGGGGAARWETEALQRMTRLLAKAGNTEDLQAAFEALDDSGTGTLSRQQFAEGLEVRGRVQLVSSGGCLRVHRC